LIFSVLVLLVRSQIQCRLDHRLIPMNTPQHRHLRIQCRHSAIGWVVYWNFSSKVKQLRRQLTLRMTTLNTKMTMLRSIHRDQAMIKTTLNLATDQQHEYRENQHGSQHGQ